MKKSSPKLLAQKHTWLIWKYLFNYYKWGDCMYPFTLLMIYPSTTPHTFIYRSCCLFNIDAGKKVSEVSKINLHTHTEIFLEKKKEVNFQPHFYPFWYPFFELISFIVIVNITNISSEAAAQNGVYFFIYTHVKKYRILFPLEYEWCWCGRKYISSLEIVPCFY